MWLPAPRRAAGYAPRTKSSSVATETRLEVPQGLCVARPGDLDEVVVMGAGNGHERLRLRRQLEEPATVPEGHDLIVFPMHDEHGTAHAPDLGRVAEFVEGKE